MRRLPSAALVLTLLAASAARAEGPGLMVSDSLVLHLGLAIGVGYDSNVFFQSGNPNDSGVGAAYLPARPTIDLATRSVQRGGAEPHTLDFRLHLGSDIRALASTDPNVYSHWSAGIDAGIAATIFPQGATTFDIFDTYSRVSTPPYRSVINPGTASGNINYDMNQLGLRLRLRPGGQRLEIGAQYVLGFYLFENPEFRGKDFISNDFQLRASWKFFPKTALYLNAQETLYTYVVQDANTPPSAYPLRVVLGIIGLITAKLEINANVGYGNSFTQAGGSNYPSSPSYNNAIGQVELKWKPTLLTSVVVGYRHDFPQALVGTFYDLDTAYAGVQQQIWRFVLGLRGAWERRAYHGDLGPDGLVNNENDQRVDDVLMLHLQLDLPIRDWLYASIGDDLAKNRSTCALTPPMGGAPAILEPCSYFRNDVWLRFGVTY